MTVLGARAHRLRSDAALLRRFRAGDETAFATLHDRHGAAIRSYARFMLRGTRHDPDDAAQDVFLRAYEALRRDRREIDVRSWLFRVAHNRCVDALRLPRGEELPEELDGGRDLDPALAVERREAFRAVLRDIGALTEGQRSALLLREVGGLPHEEIAEALGISTTASRMLVHRARLELTAAAEARETTCVEVRERLTAAMDEGRRTARRDRRHVDTCADCTIWHRTHARVERELAVLGNGVGLAGLLKGLGLTTAGAGGGAAAGATAGTGGIAAKVAAGACCAALGVGAAAGVTTRHGDPPPRSTRPAAHAHDARPPSANAARPAPSRSLPRTQPARPAVGTTAAKRTPSRSRPAAQQAVPPATVDLHDLEEQPRLAARPPATSTATKPHTIDLADFAGR